MEGKKEKEKIYRKEKHKGLGGILGKGRKEKRKKIEKIKNKKIRLKSRDYQKVIFQSHFFKLTINQHSLLITIFHQHDRKTKTRRKKKDLGEKIIKKLWLHVNYDQIYMQINTFSFLPIHQHRTIYPNTPNKAFKYLHGSSLTSLTSFCLLTIAGWKSCAVQVSVGRIPRGRW